MTGKAFSYSAKWWWDSWHERGFLYHLAKEMRILSDRREDDVWKIGGIPVSEIEKLTEDSTNEQLKKPSMAETLSAIMIPGKLPEAFCVHKGHFVWSGNDSHMLREQGGRALARYLNLIKEIAPEEPVRIVAHSHGCNVVKLASSSELLNPSVHIDRAVFLACPHFNIRVLRKTKYPYILDSSKFGQVLNLYSPSDSVQVKVAQDFPGPPDNPDFTIGVVQAWREEQDPRTRNVYINYETPTEDSGIKAHTAMHGRTLGALCGVLLSCREDEFSERYDSVRKTSLPVPAGDFG